MSHASAFDSQRTCLLAARRARCARRTLILTRLPLRTPARAATLLWEQALSSFDSVLIPIATIPGMHPAKPLVISL